MSAGTVVFWFSGTGNSFHAARSISAALGANLTPLLRARSEDAATWSQAILVFPVYAFAPPRCVAEFAQSFPFSPECELRAVATCGGMPGAALYILGKLLEQRGLGLRRGDAVTLPANYPPLGGAPKPEKQARLLHRAELKLGEIIDDIRTGAVNPTGEIRPLSWLWWQVYRRGVPDFRKADRKFRADEKCTGCGRCARVCPVGNIVLREGKPVWGGACQQCFACFNWCPTEAMQFGRSQAQIRYHHPGAVLSDLKAQGGEHV